MKKLSVFIALYIILSSCTKTVDQVVKIIKEDVSVHGKKYKVPVEIETRSEGMSIGFGLKKGTTTANGEFYFQSPELGEYTQNQEDFKKGSRDVDLVLTQWDSMDPNEQRNLLGSAVVHIKFNKGTQVGNNITGTGTWTFGEIKGTMTKYVSEGAGVLKYKYETFPDEEFAHPIETVLLKGFMKK